MPCDLSGPVNEAYDPLSILTHARKRMLDRPTHKSAVVRRSVWRLARKKPPAQRPAILSGVGGREYAISLNR